MNSQDLWIGSIFHPFHGNDPGAGWFISGGWPERAAAHLLDFYGSSCIVFAAETLVCFSVQPASLLSWLTPQSCLPLKFALPNVLSDKERHMQRWTGLSLVTSKSWMWLCKTCTWGSSLNPASVLPTRQTIWIYSFLPATCHILQGLHGDLAIYLSSEKPWCTETAALSSRVHM